MNAEQIAKNADPRIRDEVLVLARQVLAIADKLSEAESEITDQKIVVPYDNGGGQTGIRENPFYTAYEKLLASYTKALTSLREMIGEAESDGLTSLDAFRSRVKIAK